MTTLHDFGSVLGQPLDNLFGLLQCYDHGFGTFVKWPSISGGFLDIVG